MRQILIGAALTISAGAALAADAPACPGGDQCASTLAVIRRETNSWRWPVFTFVYMTVLAYIGAFSIYQLGSWWSV